MDYITHYESPIGPLTLASDGQAITALLFDGETYFDNAFGRVFEIIELSLEEAGELPAFAQALKWLDIYFSGKDPGFVPPISLQLATPFCQEVCEIMLTIPFGGTMSYGQISDIIAKRRGIKKMAAQAVGGAVGRNPISLIVPCHRVIGTDGSLTGYGGGLDKKQKLLLLEGHTEYR